MRPEGREGQAHFLVLSAASGDLLNPLLHQTRASERSAKYCASWTTLLWRNSIMLTVHAGLAK